MRDSAIHVEGNEEAIKVSVMQELMSLCEHGTVIIESNPCKFDCTVTVSTDNGPVTSKHGIEPDSEGNFAHPLALCLYDLRSVWDKARLKNNQTLSDASRG